MEGMLEQSILQMLRATKRAHSGYCYPMRLDFDETYLAQDSKGQIVVYIFMFKLGQCISVL